MLLEPTTVLPETIADELRSSILNQTDAPGTTLTESAVALRFGVARPTARLAIDKLVADGLLRREAHRAARVPELSGADIVDLYDNRAVIEAAAMASLARSGTIPAQALASHRAIATSDYFASHDIAFHRSLVAGQHSPRLARMHQLLMGEIELCIGQVQAAHLLTAGEVHRQHQGILDAITSGDADAAAQLTRDHIVGARDALLAHIDTRNA
ncbi:MAG: GntR family transcriptional regulator [Rhodoglobus sp.]